MNKLYKVFYGNKENRQHMLVIAFSSNEAKSIVNHNLQDVNWTQEFRLSCPLKFKL